MTAVGLVAAARSAAAAAAVVTQRRPRRRVLFHIEARSGAQGFDATRLAGGLPSQVVSDAEIVVVGEHHNWASDHELETELLQAIAAARAPRPVLLGLEMVDQPLQPVLDAFSAGDVAIDDLPAALDWNKRWGWRFKKYRPLFEAAREVGARCVALNVPAELQQRVQLGGLAALTGEERVQYMPDASGFLASTALPGAYLEIAVTRGYDDMLAAGLLGSKDREVATLDRFINVRQLRDEAMATAALRELRSKSPASGMVLVAGLQHVMFEYGLVARLRRLGARGIQSVLLNPTREEAQPPIPPEAIPEYRDLDLSFRVVPEERDLVLPLPGADVRSWPKRADYLWTDVSV